ncbi:peroxidase family protein [Aeoliella sp.]|uniref:peroxidase family protein n=1 Tax=Aeoliella sp. TaxID=2795800 RepID=UPI003CCBE77C
MIDTLVSSLRTRQLCAALLAAGLLGGTAVAQPFRTFDGSGNNSVNSDWGQAGTAFLRVSPDSYPDGIGDVFLSSPDVPNPRVVSNALFNQTSPIDSTNGMSSGVWQWGQFLDHDITFTPTNSAEPHMIFGPVNDPYNMSMIPMNRSMVSTGNGVLRQQTNAISAYIDASNVYGSDQQTADALRSGVGGKLLTSSNNLLPTTSDVTNVHMDNGGNPTTMFVAGDVRANEQLGLTAMHTLFMREHNRIAQLLVDNEGYDPVNDDELIYQKARTIVGAEMQSITFNEFLPALLGDYAPQAVDYNYDANVNASITNEFATSLFRVGHTMLNENLLLAGEKGQVVGQIALRDAYFTGSNVIGSQPELVDKLLMGLATQTAQEIDTKLVDDVRNFLFAPHQGMGLDLASLNIERGREHGLADYNTMLATYETLMSGVDGFDSIDLSAAVDFNDLNTSAEVIAELELLYDSVDDLDSWMMALAETHVDGANVGPLILAGLVDQFTRLRDGDSHFYMGNSYLWSDEVGGIVDFDNLVLMDIVAWNTEMKNSPMNFFQVAAVPEPGTLVLLGIGLVGFVVARRKRQIHPN